MKHVTGLFAFAFLMGGAPGTEPNNGYCIGKQCFAVFPARSDSTAALDQCRDKGGHLMTVRSSVEHDTLTLLLGSLPGSFWIGLHLPSGCPQSEAGLRGFQWVTGDSQSNFQNWALTFSTSCSAPRCVTVSKQDDFKWTQTSCDVHAAGFLCEYNFQNPCGRLPVRVDETVTYKTHYGFEGEDLLSLPPGTIAVRTPSGTKHICFSQQWLQAPWSCEIEEGGCEDKCVGGHGVFSCVCPPGYAVNPANNVTCEVDEDDPCVPLRCQHHCLKNSDSYVCTCKQGFNVAEDGRTCVDFNDCKDARQCPGKNLKCVNAVGGFWCECEDGYRLSNGQCTDVDECASAPCEHECHNTAGSYTCSCFNGYAPDPGAPEKCRLYCGVEECAAVCDPNNHLECYCPDGYVYDEREQHVVCVDIDECLFGYCDQRCQNTYGGYVCSCYPGYTLVKHYKCVKSEDDTDTDGWEGSGASTTTPPVLTTTGVKKPPEPTRRPTQSSAGKLAGIIVGVVFVVLLLVFVVHHVLKGREWQYVDAHALHHVTSDKELPKDTQ
ncbi:thrombomodulin-like [Thalassophryne amazonica]|uniref:thrombomodulin-like n=1 Tax=Thalassophryne amazonica TaxID=390379 RepID=UPI001470E940|nr:thrombomodulin-like [Thalassophryne amazonica]